MTARLARIPTPLAVALVAAGLLLSGLLVGYEPISGDPDRMYRPLKAELARAYHEGRLPYWSDRLGLGTPLVAESHVAAFYPLNQVLYRTLSVPAAYRLAMWLHYLMLVAATYAYARTLEITPWGSALAAVAFTFCGFQAIHSSHEWAYHVLPYLPLALVAAERFLATGRLVWLPALAALWGVQLTLGHFQLQAWTGALVLAAGIWRVVVDRRPWHRGALLLVGLAWGAGLAAVQLVPSWEMARFTRTSSRQVQELLFYPYPPAHWAELAVPRLFLGLPGGPEDRYWFSQQTTGYEACLYVGTLPLILAIVGAVASLRERPLRPWLVAVPLTFALATLPRWWPTGYVWWLQLPVVGFFRSPGRYTVLSSLGLSLLAGRGLDRALTPRQFRAGLALGLVFGAAAAGWALWWAQGPILSRSLGPQGLVHTLGLAGAAWAISVMLILAWRLGRVGPVALVVFAAMELGLLYYHSTTEWGWSVRLPEDSPVLTRLAALGGVRRVAGSLGDLPVRAGKAPAYPYLGMSPELPNRLLEPRPPWRGAAPTVATAWLRLFGVTHGVWSDRPGQPDADVLFEGADAALDRLVYHPPGAPAHATWRLVQYSSVYPAARAARVAIVVASEAELLAQLAQAGAEDRVWFLAADSPAADGQPRASSARILAADDQRFTVEHDGTCDVVLQRAYYPGWTARRDGGPETPVARADAGLQAVRLPGRGTTRVTLQYHPTGQTAAAAVSASALGLVILAVPLLLRRRGRGPGSGS